MSERYGTPSLSHIRPAMEHAIQTLNTPSQHAKVLAWVERAKQEVSKLS